MAAFLTPRLRQLFGPIMQKAGPGVWAKDVGNYLGVGGPGNIREGLPIPALCCNFTQATAVPQYPEGTDPAPAYTFTRGSNATVIDHEGIIRECLDNEIRFQGARRVENLFEQSNNFTDAAWIKTNVVVTPDVLDGTRMQGTGGTSWKFGNSTYTEQGESYVVSIEVRSYDGSEQRFRLIVGSASPEFRISGTDWYRINFIDVPSSSIDRTIGLTRNAAKDACDIVIRNAQCEHITGQANSAPAEYVANPGDHGAGANGVKYFPYENGNTVDVNGVVTEGKGAAISGIAYLNEAAATNYLRHSNNFFDGTYWVLNQTDGSATLTPNYELGPVGLATRYEGQINANTSSSSMATLAQSIGGLTADTTYICSAYVKSLIGPSRITFVFGTANAVDIDNNWQRVTFEHTIGGTSSTFHCGLRGNSDPNKRTDLTADFLVCGIQFELAPGPTSYIPTEESEYTRLADSLSYSNVAVNADFTAGCDVTPIVANYADAAVRLFGTDDLAGLLDELRTVGAVADGWTAGTGGGEWALDKSAYPADVRNKTVCALDNAQSQIARQGSIVFSAASGITPAHSDQNVVQIGRFDNDPFPCLYHNFQLFDQALADDQLAWLSQPGREAKCK